MPDAVNVLLITGGGGRIFSSIVAEPVPPALDALTEGVKVPVTVGVPEITPVAVSTFNPVGSPLAPKLVGLFVAVI